MAAQGPAKSRALPPPHNGSTSNRGGRRHRVRARLQARTRRRRIETTRRAVPARPQLGMAEDQEPGEPPRYADLGRQLLSAIAREEKSPGGEGATARALSPSQGGRGD